MGATFDIASGTEAGRERLSNEDCVAVHDATGVVVVADGIGGGRGGEVAARVACEAIAAAAADTTAPLRSAFESARARLATLSSEDTGGMGATVAAVRLAGARAEIGHAGDVRVYLLRASPAAPASAAPRYCPPVCLASGATLVCLTRDHSSIGELVERGHVERAAAATHPLRSRVSRALKEDAVEPDESVLDLVAGDRLLVCSDGLWGMVDDARIATILEETAEPRDAVAALIAAALEGGGRDNITAAVVHWHGPGAGAPGKETP